MRRPKEIIRVPTGVQGLDTRMEGGFPLGGVVGVSGASGSGKTLLALRFLLEGARKGEKGVCIMLEEPRENLERHFTSLSFGQELADYEKSGKLRFLSFTYEDYEAVYKELFHKIVEDKKTRRLVIDSFNGILAYQEPLQSKKLISESFLAFRRQNLTSLVVLEREGTLHQFDKPILNMIDGEIRLSDRKMSIAKMRWTDIQLDSVPFKLGRSGFEA